jgi:hypothetical protein
MKAMPNKLSAIIKKAGVIYRRVFQKIWFFFSLEWLLPESFYSLHTLFEIRLEMLDADLLNILLDRAALMIETRYRVAIGSLTEQISPECIGRVTYLNEGRVEYQELLMLQEGHFGKKTIVCQPTFSTTLPDLAVELCNNLHP